MNKEFLTEVSLSRVWRHFNNTDIPVSLLTAFRNEYTYKQNVARNKKLARQIRQAGYGYVFVDGGWVENYGTEDEVKVDEDSILVIGNENDNGKLKGLIKKWIKEYNQDAALFKPEGQTDAILINQDGSEDKLGKMVADKAGEYYTRLRNRGDRQFIFESCWEEKNWISRLKSISEFT